MSTTTAGIIFLVVLVAALVVVHVPLGDYMYRVYTSEKDLRVESVIYRLIGVDARSEQTWGAYARSVLAFSSISILFLFVFQLVQGKLPLHLHDPATPMTPALAWNTAVSFVTNTNWQAYSGESTDGHLVQMAGLAVQNFVSAAVGMAVAIALVRGFARMRTGDLGNFWVDLVRTVLRILLPISVIGAIVLIAGGAIQNFHLHDQVVTTLGGTQQTITGGPVASQEVIKELGTNGGGFYNANSAHPFENPTTWTNWLGDLPAAGDQLLAAAHVRAHGRQHEAGLCDRIGHGDAVWHQRDVHDVVPVAASRHGADRDRRGDGGSRAAVRHRQLGGVRRLDDADLDRCRGLVPRLVHQPGRHDGDVQHAARRGRSRRHRLRPVRHADPGGHHRLRRRTDGRAHPGIPRQEDQPPRNQAGRSLFPDHAADRADRHRRSRWRCRANAPGCSTPARTGCRRSCTRSPPRPTTTGRPSPESASTPTGTTPPSGWPWSSAVPADGARARAGRLAGQAGPPRRNRWAHCPPIGHSSWEWSPA